MATGKQRDPRKEAYWREQWRRQRAGGLSVRDYCRRLRLPESAFYFWRREIERRDRLAQPAFVPIVLEAPITSAIEVTLASGHVVRLRAGFDAEAFQQLLALLEAPAC